MFNVTGRVSADCIYQPHIKASNGRSNDSRMKKPRYMQLMALADVNANAKSLRRCEKLGFLSYWASRSMALVRSFGI